MTEQEKKPRTLLPLRNINREILCQTIDRTSDPDNRRVPESLPENASQNTRRRRRTVSDDWYSVFGGDARLVSESTHVLNNGTWSRTN